MQREIEKLQLLVMDHETSIETLSEEYRRQQEVIAALQLQVRELSSRLKSMAEQIPAMPSQQHEIPPHY